MSLEGTHFTGLLRTLHAEGCDRPEVVVCRPVVLPPVEYESPSIEVVRMAWCEDCGAADWEVV